MTSEQAPEFFVGQAGWQIAQPLKGAFPGEGSHLQRYAAVLLAVEINSSFYRPHRPSTYERWAASTPQNFRFSVKLPKSITHLSRLENADEALARFLSEVMALGEKLGPLLVQLPPSYAFTKDNAERFFAGFRARFGGFIACEPRHPSWFSEAAQGVLCEFDVARVAADPPPCPGAETPGGASGLVYLRQHGSPVMYHSAYDAKNLAEIQRKLAKWRAAGITTWCIFDNTASGAALPNALALAKNLGIKATNRPIAETADFVFPTRRDPSDLSLRH